MALTWVAQAGLALLRSWKLSRVGPGKYLEGRPSRNPRVVMWRQRQTTSGFLLMQEPLGRWRSKQVSCTVESSLVWIKRLLTVSQSWKRDWKEC